MIFSIDFATLQQFGKKYSYSGIFRAEYVEKTERHFVDVLFVEGKVAGVRSTGSLEIDDILTLSQLGILDWTEVRREKSLFASLPALFTSSALPAISLETPIPKSPVSLQKNRSSLSHPLQRKSDVRAVRHLPILYRQVYTCIDGRKTAEEIATILQKNPGDIGKVVEALQKMDLLIML